MRKIILYIATSLNGQIALTDGSVDWLDAVPNPEKSDYGYTAFLDSIDTTVQGYNTYRQLIDREIEFPYQGKNIYVLTRKQNLDDTDLVRFISSDHVQFIRGLKQQGGKDIWLIGGGQVNTLLLKAHLIDEIQIFIMPVIIPGGIGLFELLPEEIPLDLADTIKHSSGVVELKYKVGDRFSDH